MVNILYIGDVMGEKGVASVEKFLPEIKFKLNLNLILAQAENVTEGKSMTVKDMQRLQTAGVDFFTGGNHTPSRPKIHELLKDQDQPVIGPANMVECPGPGWKFAHSEQGKVLVVSLLGQKVGKPDEIENPLHKIDEILEKNKDVPRVATIVNFHGDYSSEKVVIGYYLDGRVSAVIGDHWHVPTADAMVLPKGTAHITDVGMCGVLHSSLGVKTEVIIERWKENVTNLNQLETEGPLQFNAVLVTVDEKTGLATKIEQIQKVS